MKTEKCKEMAKMVIDNVKDRELLIEAMRILVVMDAIEVGKKEGKPVDEVRKTIEHDIDKLKCDVYELKCKLTEEDTYYDCRTSNLMHDMEKLNEKVDKFMENVKETVYNLEDKVDEAIMVGRLSGEFTF